MPILINIIYRIVGVAGEDPVSLSSTLSKSRKKNLRKKRRRLLKAQSGDAQPYRRKRRPKAKKHKEGNIIYCILYIV